MYNKGVKKGRFQSTPPVKAATAFYAMAAKLHAISIHAAREGGDRGQFISSYDGEISIHAAREGGDEQARLRKSRIALFQSTPPVKAATRMIRFGDFDFIFQSTPPVKAATIQVGYKG